MGRHTMPAPERTAQAPAAAVDGLPGWGLFATAVAAACVAWPAPHWASVAGVTALGLAVTAALWLAASLDDRARYRPAWYRPLATPGKVTMTSRSADAGPDAQVGPDAPRRVTP